MDSSKPCHLDKTRELARGAEGVVYDVRDPLLHDFGITEPTVLKEISEIQVFDDLELDILFRLRHPNLINGLRLYFPPNGDACFKQDQAGIVLPRMDQAGDDYITDRSNWNQRLGVFMQVCEGVRFLHKNKIAHLDLKLENILLKAIPSSNNQVTSTPDQHAVVSDFGLSRLMGDQATLETGQLFVTLMTRPVENLAGSRVFGYRSDIWSLGIIGVELLSRTRPFIDPMFFLGFLAAYRAMTKMPITIDPNYWTKDLIGMVSDEATGQYRRFIERHGFDFLVTSQGPKSEWYDPTKRRLLLNRLVGNDVLGGILMSMLTIDPSSRPSIDDVCVALGVIPVQGFAIPSPSPVVNEKTLDLLGSYFDQVSSRLRLPSVIPSSTRTKIASEAKRLFFRSGPFVMVNLSSIYLAAITTLWMFLKMYGYGVGSFFAFVRSTRDIERWSLTLLDDPDWAIKPWTPGQPIIPSSLIVMERIIIQSMMGILVG